MNWVNFIEQHFDNGKDYNMVFAESEKELTYKVMPLHQKDGIYVQLDVNKREQNILNRVLFGSEEMVSFCQGVFNASKDRNLEFAQKSWFELEGDRYNLTYGDESTQALVDWLKIPFKEGWTETQFSFKHSCYKVGVATSQKIPSGKSQIIDLKDTGEQDLPLGIVDDLIIKLRKFCIENPLNRKHINTKVLRFVP